MLKKILKTISKHKVIVGIIILVIVGGGYFGYKTFKGNGGETRYVLAAVEKGTLIVSVSGSGQISVLNQADVKSKASGDIIYLGIKNGQEVKKGTLLAQLDDSDAQKTIRDAEANLESAKLSLEKLQGSADLAVPKNKQNAQDDLAKAYDDGLNTVANAFLDLPVVIAGLQDILFGSALGKNQQNIDYYTDYAKTYDDKVFQYKDSAYNTYQTARASYNKNFDDYKSTSRFSDNNTIESLIAETYATVKDIAEAVRNAINLIQFYKDKFIEQDLKPESVADTHLSSLNTYMGKVNSHLVSLLSAENAINNDKDAVLNADLDIESQKLTIEQREDALLDAKEKLADYFVYVPFDGIITKVNIQKGDSISGSTAVATLITKQRIAEISLNEADVAKIKVGQKVTFTFDAVEGLSITGEVLEIDTLGTVTQGVVTYNVKIGFDTQDERVKPGMSVVADIITDVKQDVLLLPNSAIKSQGNSQYVELVETPEEMKQQLLANVSGIILPNPPKSQTVEIGISNDLSSEIVSGLKEGDIVVTSTISPTTNQTNQTQRTQEFQIPGMGGQMRISR